MDNQELLLLQIVRFRQYLRGYVGKAAKCGSTVAAYHIQRKSAPQSRSSDLETCYINIYSKYRKTGPYDSKKFQANKFILFCIKNL